MSSLFAFLHHIAAFTLVAALAVEFALVRGAIDLSSARKLLRADMVVGISSGVALAVGVLRVLLFEKGSVYYLHNAALIAKLSLFAAVGLLSIIPTREFVSWRKALRAGQAPVPSDARMASIRSIVHLELALIAVLILCAALMARGVGTFG